MQDTECTAAQSPVVPTGSWPGNVTLLRSGSGRLRLGRLGSGGKPPGRGIRPAVTNNAVRLGIITGALFTLVLFYNEANVGRATRDSGDEELGVDLTLTGVTPQKKCHNIQISGLFFFCRCRR